MLIIRYISIVENLHIIIHYNIETSHCVIYHNYYCY